MLLLLLCVVNVAAAVPSLFPKKTRVHALTVASRVKVSSGVGVVVVGGGGGSAATTPSKTHDARLS